MSNTEISLFLFEGEHLVRVVDRDSAPWFVAADVCRVLNIKNAAQAILPLDDDEKGICSTYTPGGMQEVLTISEGGLYTLILRSRNATTPGTPAHRFRKWVTSEVLPTIRKTGAYAPAQDAIPHADVVKIADALIVSDRMVTELQGRVARLEAKSGVLSAIPGPYDPIAEAFEWAKRRKQTPSDEPTISIPEAARTLNMLETTLLDTLKHQAATFVNAGVIVQKEVIICRPDGTEDARTQVRVTRSGMAKLSFHASEMRWPQ